MDLLEERVNRIKDTPEWIVAGLMIEMTNKFAERMEEIGMTENELALKVGLTRFRVRNVFECKHSASIKDIVTIAARRSTR